MPAASPSLIQPVAKWLLLSTISAWLAGNDARVPVLQEARGGPKGLNVMVFFLLERPTRQERATDRLGSAMPLLSDKVSKKGSIRLSFQLMTHPNQQVTKFDQLIGAELKYTHFIACVAFLL